MNADRRPRPAPDRAPARPAAGPRVSLRARAVRAATRGAILLVLLPLLPPGESLAWQIGHRTVTWQDPARSNRSIQTEVYYPADVAGENVPVGGDGTVRFPVVVFGHGFLMAVTAYQYVWEGLAPQGYIVALPRTEGSLLPNHGQFGQDLAFLADTLRGEGSLPASFLFQRVAGTAAVTGHSMGGGASILAASGHASITAVANLAAANTNPSAIDAAPGVTAPVLMFSGSADCVTPPSQHQIPIYDALGSDCRTRVTLTGASHCQFAEYNFNCSLGEGGCPTPSLTRAAQHALTLLFLQPWLDAQLKEDGAAWIAFQDLLATNGGITYAQDCSLEGIEPPIASARGVPRLTLAPNPLRRELGGTVRIGLELPAPASVAIRVLSVDGRLRRTLRGGGTLPAGAHGWSWDGTDDSGARLPSGIYLCEARADGRLARRNLVLLR